MGRNMLNILYLLIRKSPVIQYHEHTIKIKSKHKMLFSQLITFLHESYIQCFFFLYLFNILKLHMTC